MSKTIRVNRTIKPTLDLYIDQDGVIEYLERLSTSIQKHRLTLTEVFTRDIVGNYGSVQGLIAPKMSTSFNWHLATTGQDEGYWQPVSEEGMTTIEILYTGMDIHERFGNRLPAGIWWEFAEDPENPDPKTRTLERDYAYFQETGIDPVVESPKQAHHKQAIQRGLFNVTKKELKNVEFYLDLIMKEKEVAVVTPNQMGWKR